MKTARENVEDRRSAPASRSWRALVAGALLGLGVSDASAAQDADLEALVAAERQEADLLRRRGKVREAGRLLGELLEDEPTDAATRTLRAWCLLERGKYDRALTDAHRATEDAAAGGARELRAACARTAAEILLTLGRYTEALETLDAARDVLVPATDARDAWILGRALLESGDQSGAWRVFELGVQSGGDQPWDGLLAKARCEQRVGRIERASRTVLEADRAARGGSGNEPDVLVALADLYFESEREVEAQGKRSAAPLYWDALEHHPSHAGALLGLFRMHRFNRRRTSRSPESILGDLLGANPDSIDGLLAAASADLEDGQLVRARERLARLGELAPERRERRTLLAALAWIEHRRDDCHAMLDELARTAPHDSRPEREVGRHLLELYRFAEGVPFLQRATERDPSDYEAWTQYARGLANTGDEDAAREAFEKARLAARGRQDAWRNNMALVLERMDAEMVVEDFGELSFAWRPDAAEVLRTYLLPFYSDARTELAERYGHTPEPARIEVFRRHRDFSVRSVGFEGFPALGVCFGPVVTSLSPLSEMRGNFSWARTCFHEFSHVVHLGLSHNRCPRWITEGLATWEEVARNPAWTRNLRRELVDAYANEDLIPVRELNRAFRGPRILFGYYQGGLLCELLIERHGFPPMIHLLEAFDRGLDLDQALDEVFSTTPEALDEAFDAFVAARIASLAIEPRWNPRRLGRLRLTLRREPPTEEVERERWADDLCTLAWGSWQQGRQLDAEESLRRLEEAGLRPLRAQFLRGEIALASGSRKKARTLWQAAVDAGGRDYRALVGLAALQLEQDDLEAGERLLLLAESVFPGYDDIELSAELRLVRFYQDRGEEEQAMRARERWLAWNAGELAMRLEVARWHVAEGRHEDAARLYDEANQIDLFLARLHGEWGESLRALGRFEEALREFRVALMIPPELDADRARAHAGDDGEPAPFVPPSMLPSEDGGEPKGGVAREAELHALSAACLKELGREDESRAATARALELDPDCELARGLW